MCSIIQIIYKMKKILISSILICVSFSLKAQNSLEFNRVIDTIIQVSTGPTYVSIYNKFLGDSISPTSGKVWKIENIVLNRGRVFNSNNTFPNGQYNLSKCINPGDYESNILVGVDIVDSGTDSNLMIGEPVVASTPVIQNPLAEQLKFPFWLDTNSKIRIFIKQRASQGQFDATHEVCLKFFETNAYISILEFNTP